MKSNLQYGTIQDIIWRFFVEQQPDDDEPEWPSDIPDHPLRPWPWDPEDPDDDNDVNSNQRNLGLPIENIFVKKEQENETKKVGRNT